MLETLSLWLHSTMTGKVLLTALISMLPVVELRGGLPAGVALGLPIPLSFAASLLGNMLPVPFVTTERRARTSVSLVARLHMDLFRDTGG